MKANEAPEKIWVHELSAKELNVPLKEYHIEYIRADAFIEKACEYLNRTCRRFILTESDIEDFKNYMEEEIIKLRRLTGLGISECRKAYEKFGNIEEAYKYLRDKWSGVWTTADR